MNFPMKRILTALFLFVALSAYSLSAQSMMVPSAFQDQYQGRLASITSEVTQQGEGSTGLEPETEETVEERVSQVTIKKQAKELRLMKEKMKALESALRKKIEADVRKDEGERNKLGLSEREKSGNYVERPEDWRESLGLDEAEVEKLTDSRMIELDIALRMPRWLRHPALSRTTRKIFDRMIEKRVKILTEAELEPFGKEFFNKGEDIRPTLDQSPAPPSYVLGPGDGFNVHVWSDLGEESVYNVSVNPEGQVYIPTLGIIGVQGLMLSEFEETVLGKISEKFKHFKGRVTLNRVRKIQVFVTGEVEKPGAQIVTALSTAFNGLYRAGGPTERGTMRDIRVIRKNKHVSRLDLYKYFLAGDKSQDVSLENGDTIFIGPVGKRVKVNGQVLRPAIYELSKEKSLAAILGLAGGVEPSAYSRRIKIYRWQGEERRQILDIEGSKTDEGKFEIENGDEIVVEKTIEKIGNNVKIEGAVQKPGEYAVEEGETLSWLIKKAGGLIGEETSYHAGQIIRKSDRGREELLAFDPSKAVKKDGEHDFVLKPLDRVKIFPEIEVSPDSRKVKISGAVRRQGEYLFRDGITIRDLILRAQGLTIEASNDAEVARILRGKEAEIKKVDLSEVMKNPKSPENIELQPMDQITILAEGNRSVEAPLVILKGEVKRPGPYALRKPGETLGELVERAGGLTPEAFPKGTIFRRLTNEIVEDEHLRFAEVVQEDLYKQASLDLRADLIRAGGRLSDIMPEDFAKKDSSGKLRLGSADSQEMLEDEELSEISESDSLSTAKMKTARSTKSFSTNIPSRSLNTERVRIPIRLEAILKDKTKEDISLRNGDQILIPRVPATISIVGAVINPSNILFKPNQSARYYINRVGGFAQHSNHAKTLILRANGEVFPLARIKEIELGDIVLVPPKPKLIRKSVQERWQTLVSVGQILANLAVSYKVLLKD